MRDKVTDVIMKGRLTPQMAVPPTGNVPPADGASARPVPAPAPAGTGGVAPPAAVPAARAMPPRPAAAVPATATLGAAGQAARGNRAPGGATRSTPKSAAIGRNEVVTVIDPQTGARQEMKYKKAKPLLEQGWKLA